jgi:hypothetical protein
MKRRIAKVKPISPRRRKKKQKSPETVDTCDHCGKPLGRTCARTDGSAISAGGEGIIAGKIQGKWMFFCSMSCASDGTGDMAGKWVCGKSPFS